jgi:hypothetical protein
LQPQEYSIVNNDAPGRTGWKFAGGSPAADYILFRGQEKVIKEKAAQVRRS